jgi:ribosomal protein S18 acetylase RimI-like enzyme
LTARVYLAEGYASADYAQRLADTPARARAGELLVAVDGPVLLGAVSLFTAAAGPDWAEDATAGEAVLRMLVVDPVARGRGVGAALTEAAMVRAARLGCLRMVLSSHPDMRAAHRLYLRLGFVRRPERDREVRPGLRLFRFDAALGCCPWCGRPAVGGTPHPDCLAARPYDPPRFCSRCGRRLVVQVLPNTWTARCAVHGPTSP